MGERGNWEGMKAAATRMSDDDGKGNGGGEAACGMWNTFVKTTERRVGIPSVNSPA